MNDNKHLSKFGIGRHVRLDPPKAQIVGVLFQADDRDGVVRPFYSVLMGGQRVDGVREDDIIGIDFQEEARVKEVERHAAAYRESVAKVSPISAAVGSALAAGDDVPGAVDPGEGLADPLPGDETYGRFGAPMPESVAAAEGDAAFEPRS